jgi:hypothetical protein
MLESIDSFLDGLEIEVMSEKTFLHERALLEKEFLVTYGIVPERIDQQIRDGGISENDLVHRWIELRCLEPDILPTKD